MKKYYGIILLVFITLFCLCFFACGEDAPPLGAPQEAPKEEIIPTACVDILKIGKADCIVINTGSHVLMIDTGESENLPRIHAYMQEKGYERIDALIITHYDKDHIGGAEEILERYDVKAVFESSFTEASAEYVQYHEVAGEKGIEIKKLSENARLELDGNVVDILIPQMKKYSTEKDNNISLIVSVKCGENKLLFCGDALELRMAELVYDKVGHYDFVKLPHHGSYLANYPMVLEELTPTYCAITCSGKNPADDKTLSLLQDIGAEVYQTSNGIISVSAGKDGININQ